MSPPLVSVIIPCYNAERWIRETLHNALAQEGVALEIIVVDDGSTDASAEIVQREFPTVSLLRTPNGGVSRARNIGMAAAQGEFLQFLDADDFLGSGKLAQQVATLEKSQADIAYGDWERWLMGATGGSGTVETLCGQMAGAPETAIFTCDFWKPIHAYLFRHSFVRQMGGWHEKLAVGEDVRFVLDGALRGARFAYCPGTMVRYRIHPGSASTRDPYRFNHDVYRNALEIEAWWRTHGGLTAEREAAVVRVLEHVAQASYGSHRPLFEQALTDLERLRPGYRPHQPRCLALMSRLVGYRRAQALALSLQRGKKTLRPLRDRARTLRRR